MANMFFFLVKEWSSIETNQEQKELRLLRLQQDL